MEKSEDRVRGIREAAQRAQTEASLELVKLFEKLREREVERVGTEGEEMIQATEKEVRMLRGTKRKQITNRKQQMMQMRKTVEGDIKEAVQQMKGKESEVKEELHDRYEANMKQRRRNTKESHELYRGLSELLGVPGNRGDGGTVGNEE